MYNKKAISEALAKLNKAKAPKQEPDIIYSPRGQWDHPGKVTRVPSEHITMQGVHTPLLGIDNMGNQQMMYPGAEYTFPGADYVDEYPMMQSGGQRPILYVDPNDPAGRARYQAHQDSLTIYDAGKRAESYYKDAYPLLLDASSKRKTTEELRNIADTLLKKHRLLLGSPEHNKFIKASDREESRHSTFLTEEKGEDITFPTSDGEYHHGFRTYNTYKPSQPVKYKPDPEIVAKQQQLIDAGFDIGKADGIWGPKSQAAWEQMQNKQQEVPTKSVDNLDKQVETTALTLQREESPTGITRQVPKTEWKQLPNGTWYQDTKAGHKAGVEEHTMMQTGGSPTAADSLALRNNAIAVQNYYNSDRYDSYFTEDVNTDPFQEINRAYYWYKMAPARNETHPQTIAFNKGEATEPVYLDEKDYRKNINKNKFYQRELSNSIIDPRSPMQLFDRRIIPTSKITLGNNKKGDVYSGDFVEMYQYDPLAVTPWGMLDEAQKKERLKRFGTEGTPYSDGTSYEKETEEVEEKVKKEPNLNTDLAAWLKTQGASASYADRKKLYEQATGKTDYKGTAEQNIGLLNLVKERGLDYKIDNLEKVPSNTSDETAFVKSLSKMPERSEESTGAPITPLPVKEEPKGLTRQVPKTTTEWNPQLQMYVPVTRGGLDTVEDTGVDIGGRKLRYGGLTTGLTNTKGNLLMNNKGKRMMAQSGSLSATNELFLGNPLVTKRRRAVFVPGHDFQRGGRTNPMVTSTGIRGDISYESERDSPVYRAGYQKTFDNLGDNRDKLALNPYLMYNEGLGAGFTADYRMRGSMLPDPTTQGANVKVRTEYTPQEGASFDFRAGPTFDYKVNDSFVGFNPYMGMGYRKSDRLNEADLTKKETTFKTGIEGYLEKDFKNKSSLGVYADVGLDPAAGKKDEYLEGNLTDTLTLSPYANIGVRYNLPVSKKRKLPTKKPVTPRSKFQQGGFIELELSPEEIEQYKKGGYVVEELPKAQAGLNKRLTAQQVIEAQRLQENQKNFFNFDQAPEYVGYDGARYPSASDRPKPITETPRQSQVDYVINYNKAVGEQAKAIKEAKPGISQKQAVQEAEFLIQNSGQPQAEIRQLDLEGQDKDRLFLDKAGDAQSFGDYATTAWNVITNPIDAATAFMSPGGFGSNFNINQNTVEKLQRRGLLDRESWQDNAMMNVVSMLPYGVHGLGQVAALRDLYQSGEQLAYDPSLENAGWAALDLAGARMGVTPASNRLLRMQGRRALDQAGDYLTTQTPLKNTYKINPWAFKPNSNSAYRMIGDEKGLASAVESGYLQPSTTGSDINKVHNAAHYQIGVPSDTRKYFGRTWDRGYKGPYMAEVPNATTDVRFAQGPGGREMGSNVWTYPNNYIPLSEAKLYKQDWLKGYKPVEVPKQLPGSPNVTLKSFINTDGNLYGLIKRPSLSKQLKMSSSEDILTKNNFWSKKELDEYIKQKKQQNKMWDDLYKEYESINPDKTPNELNELFPHLKEKFETVRNKSSINLDEKFLTEDLKKYLNQNLNQYINNTGNTRNTLRKSNLKKVLDKLDKKDVYNSDFTPTSINIGNDKIIYLPNNKFLINTWEKGRLNRKGGETGLNYKQGGSINLELTDEEIKWYQKGGYTVEEYQDGGEIISKHGWDYKKEGDKYFTKKVGDDKWIEPTGTALTAIQQKVFGDVEYTAEDKKLDYINNVQLLIDQGYTLNDLVKQRVGTKEGLLNLFPQLDDSTAAPAEAQPKQQEELVNKRFPITLGLADYNKPKTFSTDIEAIKARAKKDALANVEKETAVSERPVEMPNIPTWRDIPAVDFSSRQPRSLQEIPNMSNWQDFAPLLNQNLSIPEYIEADLTEDEIKELEAEGHVIEEVKESFLDNLQNNVSKESVYNRGTNTFDPLGRKLKTPQSQQEIQDAADWYNQTAESKGLKEWKPESIRLRSFGETELGNAVSELGEEIEKYTGWAKRLGVKEGVIDPLDFDTEITETIDFKTPKKQTEDLAGDDLKPQGLKIHDVTSNKHLRYENEFDLSKGQKYLPIANVGNSNSKTQYNNVEGIAHFLLDTDLTTGYQHPYAVNNVNQQLASPKPVMSPGSTVEEAYVPVYTNNADGTVTLTYKKHSELEESSFAPINTPAGTLLEGYTGLPYNIKSILRQYRFTDLDWEGKGTPGGLNNSFKNSIAGLNTVTGEATNLIYPNAKNGKKAYGKFGGASVVFIVPNSNIAVDFAGSIEDIKNKGEELSEKYGIELNDLIVGFHDIGSFSAKPAANEKGELKFKQWADFNNEPYTGGGLAIIKE